MLLHEDSFFLSLSLSEHTLPSNASIPNDFFVEAGGIDLSFLIIVQSMFLVAEKEKRLNSGKNRNAQNAIAICFLVYHAMPSKPNSKKRKKRIVSSYLLFVSSCQYLISYAT